MKRRRGSLSGAEHANYNVVAMLNGQGNAQERYRYGHGKVRIWNQNGYELASGGIPFSALKNKIMFQGRRRDPETGLYYYRNRMYHAELGRFLQRDPLEYGDGMSLYEFVGGAPTGAVDPMGEGSAKEVYKVLKALGYLEDAFTLSADKALKHHKQWKNSWEAARIHQEVQRMFDIAEKRAKGEGPGPTAKELVNIVIDLGAFAERYAPGAGYMSAWEDLRKAANEAVDIFDLNNACTLCINSEGHGIASVAAYNTYETWMNQWHAGDRQKRPRLEHIWNGMKDEKQKFGLPLIAWEQHGWSYWKLPGFPRLLCMRCGGKGVLQAQVDGVGIRSCFAGGRVRRFDKSKYK